MKAIYVPQKKSDTLAHLKHLNDDLYINQVVSKMGDGEEKKQVTVIKFDS